MPSREWSYLQGPEWDALSYEEKLKAIELIGADDPEYMALPDEEKAVVRREFAGEAPSGGLSGILHSGLAGLAGGYKSLVDTVRGFHEAPVRLARAAGAEGLAGALEYNPILMATKAAGEWLGEQEAEQAAQGGEGFLASAANVLGQTPGVASKFGLEMAGGPGKLKALGAAVKGLAQVGGLELVSRLGRGEELPEAATGAATEAGMVGAFGGIGKLASGIAKPGLRALAHMGGTAALGGALEVPAVLSGERTPQEAAGSALGLAALAGFGEIKSARKLSAVRAKLQAPREQKGEGMDETTAYRVAELFRTGRTEEANAEIAAWREAHAAAAPPKPPPPPAPPDTRTADQVIADQRAELGIDRRPSLREAMANLQTARQELDTGPGIPAAQAALLRLRMARDQAGGPVEFPGPKPTEEAAVRVGLGDAFRRANPLPEEHQLPEDQVRAARLELGLGTEANAREIEQARREVVSLANEFGLPAERIAALPMGQLYQALERLRAAKDALGREVPARQPVAQTMQQGYEALFNQSMERARARVEELRNPPYVPRPFPVAMEELRSVLTPAINAPLPEAEPLGPLSPAERIFQARAKAVGKLRGLNEIRRRLALQGEPPPSEPGPPPPPAPPAVPLVAAREGVEGTVVRAKTHDAANDVPSTWTRPGHFYRGMEEAEFLSTVGKGTGIQSRGDYSTSAEGTSLTHQAENAESYVNFGRSDPRKTGRPTYVVEVSGQDGLQQSRDGYFKAAQAIPQERITRIIEMRGQDGEVVAREIPLPKGAPNAQEARTPTQAASGQEGIEGGAGRQVRVRNAPQKRVEAGKGEEGEVGPVGSPLIPPVQRPLQPVTTGESIGPRHIKDFIEQDLGIPTSVGGFRNPKRGLAGIWKQDSQIIRQAQWGDVDTQAHELGHAFVTQKMGGTFRSPSTPVQAELEALGVALYGKKAPNAGYEQEGFAELMRHWLTSPDTARAQAPQATAWLESQLLGRGGPGEAIGSKMRQLQDMYRQYAEQGAAERSKHAISWETPTPKTTLREVADTVSEKLTDAAIRVLRLQERVGWTGKLFRDDPYQIIRSTQGTAPGRAAQAVLGEGIKSLREAGKVHSPSIKTILEPINQQGGEAAVQDALLYAVAERVVELSRPRKIKDPKTGEEKTVPGRTAFPMTLADAEFRVAEGRKRPGYTDMARKLNGFGNAMVDWLVETGAKTPEEGKRIKESGEFYLPLFREFLPEEGGAGGLGGRGGGLVGDVDPFRRMSETGSGRIVKNPIDSFIASVQRVYEAGDRAMANRALVKMARSVQGMGGIIDVLDTQPKDTSNRNFFSVVADGKRVWMEVKDRPLYEALTGLNSKQVPYLIGLLLGTPAKFLKLGATGLNPAFSLVTQVIRDTWEAQQQTGFQEAWKVGIRSLRQMGPAFKAQFTGKPSEAMRGWLGGGGQITTFFGMDTASTRLLRKEALAKSRLRFMTAHPITALREVLAFSEGVNRANEWNAAYKRTYAERIKAGDTPQDAHVEASLVANLAAKEITVDFTRGGTLGRQVNQVAAFFNPAMQGLSKLGRELKARPGTMMARGIAGITIPAVSLWLMNKDEEWYDNLPLWEKAMFMHAKVGDTIVRMPLPQNWALTFYTAPIAALEAARKKNPREFAKLTLPVAMGMLPDPMPSAIKPAFEAMAPVPFSQFKKRALIPKRLEGLSPELQVTQYTPSFYEAAAKVFNAVYQKATGNPTSGVSPIVLQHLVESYTGGLTRNVQGVFADKKEAADTPVVGRLFSRTGSGGRTVDELYQQFEEADTAYKSLVRLQRDGKTKEATAYAKQFSHLLGPNGQRYRLLQEAKRKLTELRKQDATGEKTQKLAAAYLRAANRGLNQWTPDT